MLRKIAAIILENRKFLVVRDGSQDFFKMPGGKIERNESDEECLQRELMEELSIIPKETEFIGSAMGVTPNGEDIEIIFWLADYDGTIKPDNEINEVLFIDSCYNKEKIKLVKNLDTYLIPKLLELDLID
ncbi:NUDIX domain-containing protein [archaeon]|nr:NUDIX domain-containing protein [archaeon]